MIIYYSGVGDKNADPETVLKDEATVMLTFFNSSKRKPEKRFIAIYKKRLKRKKNEERQKT